VSEHDVTAAASPTHAAFPAGAAANGGFRFRERLQDAAPGASRQPGADDKKVPQTSRSAAMHAVSRVATPCCCAMAAAVP